MFIEMALTGMRVLALSLLGSAILPAQAGVTATLSADADLVKMVGGGTLGLTLTVDVNEETDLGAAVLEGVNLAISVEGREVGNLQEGPRSGAVKVAAGTRIRRRLEVDLAGSGVELRADGLTRVSFVWPGLLGANTLVRVAPDVGDMAVADMDLEKTQVILSTSLGDLTLQFYPDKAPRHVENFLELAKSGFYDGTAFHRVMPGFMIQGGCPNTKEGATGVPGTGGPGYSVNAEFNDVKHVRGILSMARTSDPNSAGSQFFVVHGQASHLDNQYTAFGFLESGFDALDRIAEVPRGGPQGTEPLEPVRLHYAVVLPVTKT